MARHFAAGLFLCLLPLVAADEAPKLRVTGKVVKVSDERALQRAVSRIKSGQTILLAPGTYKLTNTLHLGTPVENVAIRGVPGNRNAVKLIGRGMNKDDLGSVPHGILLSSARNVLIADLSIGEVKFHSIALNPKGCQRVRLYNLRLFDAGEQFVKGSSSGGGKGVDDGIVEHCLIEYTNDGPPNGYTNGVDIHGGKRWIIRRNVFRNIAVGMKRQYKNPPAVLMWNGAGQTRCVGNVFIDCDRAIAFGLGKRTGFSDHTGGLIANNMIVYTKKLAGADAAIIVWDSPGTKVLHNTILMNGAYPNAIEARFAGSKDLLIQGNLHDAKVALRDGATARILHDHTKAVSAMFVDPKKGDLRLRGRVKGVVDRAPVHPDARTDIDGQQRKRAADLGADEYRKK